MPEVLYLYTMAFPYGRGEAFLEAEVDVLADSFAKIVVIPMSNTGSKRPLPSNFEVVDIFNKPYTSSVIEKVQFFLAAKMNKSFWKDWRYQMSYGSEIVSKSNALEKFIRKNPSGLHYSYWFEEWSLVLSWLVKKGSLKSYVSRAHGYDLYDDRARIGYFPWREMQLQGLSTLFSCSDTGAEYLRKNFPSFANKIETSFLGSIDYGETNVKESETYHLVSCSNVIPLKRVDRIANVLSKIKLNVFWMHMGDGVEMEKVKAIANKFPDNIQYSLDGSVPHIAVMEYYKNNAVDCFINVSTTEGIPVSMMESISFGIPVLATDVGGVSEIVNEHTGVLIDVDFTDDELADILTSMLQNNKNTSVKKEIRKFWENNFSAVTNYHDFCKRLRKTYVI